MKIRLVFILFFGLLGSAILLSNKNGRASQEKAGNTGAPGDQALPNGTPITCNSCHLASPITCSTAVSVLDTAGNAVTQYKPGDKYTARVTITTLTGVPKGYGFQMIALRDNGNTDLDGFSDPGNQTVNNYKIATIPNGRTYAEHDNVSTPNIFNVVWTAPAAGTGNITFYAAGNAVDKNGLNSGDGSSVTTLKLNESGSVATHNPGAERIALQLWPNPASSVVYLSFLSPGAGNYQISVRDLSGTTVWSTAQQMPAGEQQIEIPAAGWGAGVYFLSVWGNEVSGNIKVVKI